MGNGDKHGIDSVTECHKSLNLVKPCSQGQGGM